MRRASLARLAVLMAAMFIDMMGFLMVLPLLQFRGKELGASDSMVGVLVGAYAFAALIAAPLWGRLSDRVGRRPAILLGLVASGLSYLVFGLARSLWLLMLSRLVQGLGAGTVGVIQAYVTDTVAPEERTKALGWITVASSAGVVLGPAIGSWTAALGDQAPGFVAAGMALLNVTVAAKLLPEPTTRRAPSTQRHLGRALVDVVRHPLAPAHRMIWIYATGMMAFAAMGGVLALFLQRRFHVTKTTIGYFYTLFGAVGVVMRAGVLGRAVDRLGEIRVLRLGTLMLCVGLALLPFASTMPLLCLTLAMMPIGTALLFPATTSQVSHHAPPGHIGETMGIQQAFGWVARMLGPIWAGFAFQHLGVGWPFWLAAALMASVGVLAFGASSEPHTAVEAAVEEVADEPPTVSAEPVTPGSGRAE